MFDKLLLPQNVPPTPKLGKGSKQHVVDLPSWLQAWNRYICVRLAYDRSMSLKLVKCQTIMMMLFRNHSPTRCLEYDSLFHQAAACDPTLRWDIIKKHIYVWAITQHHHNISMSQFQSSTSTFRDQLPISASLQGPHQPSQAKRLHCMPHKLQKAKKPASGTMWDAAQGGKNASSHMSAGTQAARLSTLTKCVPNVLKAPASSHPPTTLSI